MFDATSYTLQRARTAAEIELDARKQEQNYTLYRLLYLSEGQPKPNFTGMRQLTQRLKLMVANIFSL